MMNCFKSINGNTETIVTVEPISELDSNLEVKKFIKEYKFSRLGFNKIIIKRLIQKLFKEKLETKIKWNDDVWEKSSLSLLNCRFKVNNQNYFEQLKTAVQYNKYIEDLGHLVSKSRFKDITKLFIKVSDNIQLDFPLFISGNILNKLGGKVNNYELFIIDGSRRILATSLIKDNINIWVITLKLENK